MKLPESKAKDINEMLGAMELKMQGNKTYLPVAPRVAAFRHNNPDATIYTETEAIGDKHYVKATVAEGYDVRATAYKEIKFGAKGKSAAANFPLETAETGAIGRALAMCGYGTLMGDLDEDDQLADSPLLNGGK